MLVTVNTKRSWWMVRRLTPVLKSNSARSNPTILEYINRISVSYMCSSCSAILYGMWKKKYEKAIIETC